MTRLSEKTVAAKPAGGDGACVSGGVDGGSVDVGGVVAGLPVVSPPPQEARNPNARQTVKDKIFFTLSLP